MKRSLKTAILGLALIVPLLWTSQVIAGNLALTLVRTGSLVNVSDAAGLWQYEGGVVKKATTSIGYYAISRRVVSNGTSSYNTAMTTVELFLGSPYNTVVMQGSHSFSNGYFYGSTSATHNRYAFLRGGDASIIPTATAGTSTLNLNWNGANQLTLP
jgi:hypothetical protein